MRSAPGCHFRQETVCCRRGLIRISTHGLSPSIPCEMSFRGRADRLHFGRPTARVTGPAKFHRMCPKRPMASVSPLIAPPNDAAVQPHRGIAWTCSRPPAARSYTTAWLNDCQVDHMAVDDLPAPSILYVSVRPLAAAWPPPGPRPWGGGTSAILRAARYGGPARRDNDFLSKFEISATNFVGFLPALAFGAPARNAR